MIEPISIAAARAIVKIAFDKFVEGGAGELGKNLTDSITQKIMQLGTKVWKRIKGNPTAVSVLEGASQDKPEDIQKLKNYLYALWKDEQSQFSTEVKKLTDEIHFELTQIQDNSIQTQYNYGGNNSQNKITDSKVYQANTMTIHEGTQPD